MWPWTRETTCGENNQTLGINQACLKVYSQALTTVKLKTQTTECHGCVYENWGDIPPRTNTNFVIDTSYPLSFIIEDNGKKFELERHFDDFGLYVLKYHGENDTNIQIKQYPEYFWANVGAIVALCALGTLFVAGFQNLRKRCVCILQRRINNDADAEECLAPVEQEEQQGPNTRPRTAAIDAFRGIAITIMIFVNYGGGQYSAFKHAPWNGLTLADVVFPFFIWVMGISTVKSIVSQLRNSVSRKKIWKKVAKRSIILICLGIVLNSGKKSTVGLRFPGVLQRIGLTYFIHASVEIIFNKPQWEPTGNFWHSCAEIGRAPAQWVITAILAIVHVLLTFLLPVPGCPTGYLGPGGLSNGSDFPNCTGGAAGYIDRMVFTHRHMYQHPTSEKIYHSAVPYDPEGILGVLTSVVLAFLGAHAGRILLFYSEPAQKRTHIVHLLFSSIILGLGGGFLCMFSQNDGFIPINKNLWSLSYVFATGSLAFAIFTLLYYIIDVSSFWSGKPFIYAGVNSITMYLGHEIMNKQLPWRWTPITGTHFEILAMDVSATIFWIIVSYLMHLYNLRISL